MRAMQFETPGRPLALRTVDRPVPSRGQVLVKVAACGVCRTDLHVIDGELHEPRPHVVPGHEAVGTVVEIGAGVEAFSPGDRVGVPWLGWTCDECGYCRGGRENLCDRARFTGYTLDGGYADYMVCDARYCFALPVSYGDAEAAPLLCAGLIGYRALRAAGEARRIGIYGFGAAAHIVAQVARHEGREVLAFTRSGDAAAQAFARGLGAAWAGAADEAPPSPLDAAILFALAGELVPRALHAVRKGGSVVCAGIHMSDIPSFPYALLWGERRLVSVANLTRADAQAFLALAPAIPVRTTVVPYALEQANAALDALRAGRISGAAVLVPG
ncbi:MAG TPA: zinc-dependent alcohol dehydrogenase family protein [Burkholderiales bacterium]|nr:zinc-dependent alcohol dehydrogenase family protein [Burkholderiales bacterium]